MSIEPIHIISLGGGVQSSTVALRAAKGEITPMPVAAIFADTQGEPKSVYEWMDWLEKQLPFPVYRVTAGSLETRCLSNYTGEDGKKKSRASIPAFLKMHGSNEERIISRQCTADFKISPVRKECRRLMAEFGAKQVVKWIGISLDEIYRMKDPSRKYEIHRYPLIELRATRHDCLLWMERNGFPRPPRSACTFCPYHDNDEWRNMKLNAPEEFNYAVRFEQDFQRSLCGSTLNGTPFLHRSCKPLSEVDFSTEEERGQLNMFNNECEGMCGV